MDDISKSYYNSQTGMPNRDFRPRRPHTKSKNGCNQCKNRRIKCDELRPRCTRCSKGYLLCRYPDSTSGEPSPTGPPRSLQIAPGIGESTPGSLEPSGVPSPRYHSGSYFPTCPPGQVSSCRAPCPVVPPPPGPATEHSELWSHFISHTSQKLTFENEDLYTLQVGIPGLVKECPSLAATVLSVAATCSCVDIISRTETIPGDRERVMQLLVQANRHHLHSLQTMQRVIASGGPQPHEEYDHILANAWLMAAYGTASHRLRIWLHRTQPAGDLLEEQFLPNQSGWITLFQTVHEVYTSLLRHNRQGLEAGIESGHGISSFGDFWSGDVVPTEPPSTTAPGAESPVPFSEEIILRSGQPMYISRHALYPILVSSSGDALQALRKHASNVSLTLANLNGTQSHQESLSSSLSAINILSDIVSQIQNTSSSAQSDNHPHQSIGPQFDLGSGPSQGQFRPVSPWLRKYLSRALAVTPSRSLRRLLMAFLYGVPRSFLDTAKRLLDSFPLPSLGEDSSPHATFASSTLDEDDASTFLHIDPALTVLQISHDRNTETAGRTGMLTREPLDKGTDTQAYEEGPSQSGSQQNTGLQEMQAILDALAMDVFAHWLAFTLLLDGVWFFGEVGSWELGRIVGMVTSGKLKMDVQNLEDNVAYQTGAEWWPGRIYDFSDGIKTGRTHETIQPICHTMIY